MAAIIRTRRRADAAGAVTWRVIMRDAAPGSNQNWALRVPGAYSRRTAQHTVLEALHYYAAGRCTRADVRAIVRGALPT